nr:uncharacterized protein LOC112013433 [Quercus suber]
MEETSCGMAQAEYRWCFTGKSSIVAEVWALRDGLKLANSIGIQSLVVELDAKVIVELLHSNNKNNGNLSFMLDGCRSLLRKFHQVRVEHVYREGNKEADALVKWGTTMSESFVIFYLPPSSHILSIVNMDVSDMYFCRTVNASPAPVVRRQ